MELEEVRRLIDAIDPQIRTLLMKRLDCSKQVAQAKLASGDYTIYRAEREEAILHRLGETVPADRQAGYLAVVRKIMETSRMYQYGLIYDALEDPFGQLAGDQVFPAHSSRVRVRLTRENRPNSMSSILSMIGDYGYNMDRMELTGEDSKTGTVTFELLIIGDIGTVPMKKLLFQLSKESRDFSILTAY